MNETFFTIKRLQNVKFTTKILSTNCYSSYLNCIVLLTELYCFHNDAQLLKF